LNALAARRRGRLKLVESSSICMLYKQHWSGSQEALA
jgi:hypothetical protein